MKPIFVNPYEIPKIIAATTPSEAIGFLSILDLLMFAYIMKESVLLDDTGGAFL